MLSKTTFKGSKDCNVVSLRSGGWTVVLPRSFSFEGRVRTVKGFRDQIPTWEEPLVLVLDTTLECYLFLAKRNIEASEDSLGTN